MRDETANLAFEAVAIHLLLKPAEVTIGRFDRPTLSHDLGGGVVVGEVSSRVVERGENSLRQH